MNDINMAVNMFTSVFQSLRSVHLYDHKVEQEDTVQAGTYFCSGIVRLHFKYRTADARDKSSVLLKVPRLAALENYGRRMLLFEKERYVYERLLPLLYESWSREKLTPEFYGCTESFVLVLENLQESKFYAQERGNLLDLADCLIALKSFAQFHALSVKHVDRVRAELDRLTALRRNEGEWASEIYPPILKRIEKIVVPRCTARTRKKFHKYVHNLGATINLGYSPRADGFGVVVHGDAHYHNVLFRNEDRREFAVTQCKLIDFQCCRVGSPVEDIMMFLVTSVECDLFRRNIVPLFGYYLREFDDTMKKLDPNWISAYGFAELLDDLERCKAFFFYYFTSKIPCFWAGQVEVNTKGIDTVLKSERFISLCEAWMEYLL